MWCRCRNRLVRTTLHPPPSRNLDGSPTDTPERCIQAHSLHREASACMARLYLFAKQVVLLDGVEPGAVLVIREVETPASQDSWLAGHFLPAATAWAKGQPQGPVESDPFGQRLALQQLGPSQGASHASPLRLGEDAVQHGVVDKPAQVEQGSDMSRPLSSTTWAVGSLQEMLPSSGTATWLGETGC